MVTCLLDVVTTLLLVVIKFGFVVEFFRKKSTFCKFPPSRFEISITGVVVMIEFVFERYD